MQSRLQRQFTGYSLAIIGYIDKPRALGAAPSSMDSQDAAFWGFAPIKLIILALILRESNIKFDNI